MSGGSKIEKVVLKLRQEKKSYREIARILGISKSTISYWLSGNPQSVKIKQKLSEKNRRESKTRIQKIIQRSREKWEGIRKNAKEESIKEFAALIKNPLFISGICLYWGEGDSKPKNPLRISNTDPRMIHLYIKFLREILMIPSEKIKIGLILYPDLSEKESKRFWIDITGIKTDNFQKTQYIQGKHPTKRLPRGICMVITHGTVYKTKMLSWIDILHKKFTI